MATGSKGGLTGRILAGGSKTWCWAAARRELQRRGAWHDVNYWAKGQLLELDAVQGTVEGGFIDLSNLESSAVGSLMVN